MYISRHSFVIGGIHYDAVSSTVHYQAFRKHQGRDTDTISVDAVEFIAMLAQHIPPARCRGFCVTLVSLTQSCQKALRVCQNAVSVSRNTLIVL